MPTATSTIAELANREYKHGFFTDIEADTVPRGLNEDIVRMISEKKREPKFMLEWRLKAYRHWLTMEEPKWPNVHYPPIDYQDVIYYSAPRPKKTLSSRLPDASLVPATVSSERRICTRPASAKPALSTARAWIQGDSSTGIPM